LTYTGTDAQFLLAGEHFFPLCAGPAKQDKARPSDTSSKKSVYVYPIYGFNNIVFKNLIYGMNPA